MFRCAAAHANPEIKRIGLHSWLNSSHIHHASLFPDVIGASGYCNELVREFVSYRQKEKEPGKGAATKWMFDADFWQKHKLSTDEKTIQMLIDALLKENTELQGVKSSELIKAVNIAVNFINEKAGVDWYKRESQLARIRTIVRRALAKMNFDEDLIAQAATNIVNVAAELSKDAESLK